MNKITICTDGVYSGKPGHSSLAAIRCRGGIV